MTREDLEIGKIYVSDGEPVYKLVDIGADWVLVIHYSTVHYVANPEFFRLEDFLWNFERDNDDYWEDFFSSDLVYSEWQMLVNKDKE